MQKNFSCINLKPSTANTKTQVSKNNISLDNSPQNRKSNSPKYNINSADYVVTENDMGKYEPLKSNLDIFVGNNPR